MTNHLKNQIHIYSLDTSAFYNEEEQVIHRKLLKSYSYRNRLKKMKSNQDKHYSFIRKRIKKLKDELNEKLNKNTETRHLYPKYLRDNNVISVFESTLTRTLGIQTDDLSEEVIVIRAYYFRVLEDLINNGFIHNGEKYIYFSSSAGQIRTKKGVWVKESSWEKHKNTLTCGLSIKDINKQGGSNINKYLAYIALTNSASMEMKNFDINKSIVVDDLETNVNGLVDYIDRDSYEITRKKMDIPIEHTDGCGMILPKKSKKSFMVRMPFVKGLLVPFPFDKFAEENSSYIVKDIYGKEWDIKKDNIEIIFTKSQFKMWKYYNDWDDYKDRFTKYNCQAAKLNEEESVFNEVKLNYQMLQTLTDMTDVELEEVAQSTIDDILEVGSDKETMLRVLGATKSNNNKNDFQKALEIYPELLNDTHARQVIKDVKRSLVRDGKAGKLNISGKYTYICPDLYAFCERLFLGVENPKGLLKDDQVYCNLFDEGKLDMLRSPHLYREHGIKNNVLNEEWEKWFVSHGIYTSVHDTISKMLQFDVDGDKALVTDDETIVNVAERNMNDVVPLYYEMAVAPKQEISRENMYDSLILAFHANIGEISNNITKIWNSDNINLDVIKWLCMENNFVIDYAKTLYEPKRPSHVDKEISQYTKSKVPYFFICAKDKKENGVEIINNSVVNRLDYIVPNKPIQFSKVAGKFDYKMLMKNKRTKVDNDIISLYTKLDRQKKWLMNQDDVKNGDKLYIYKYIRDEILSYNDDIKHVTDVLIKHLYSNKNSRYKTTLWESFGDMILSNLKRNVLDLATCVDCDKLINNLDVRQIRCEDCQENRNKNRSRVRMLRLRAYQQD